MGLDEEMPWYYNELRFILKRNESVLEATISPLDSQIQLRWHNEIHILASLQLDSIRGLTITIDKKDDIESFCVVFEDKLVRNLVITTKPTISIFMGTYSNI